MSTPQPAAAPVAPQTPPPAAPLAKGAVAQTKGPEVPPEKPAGNGGEPTPPQPEAKTYGSQIEAELAERLGKDGIKWEEMNPKVREAMIASEMKSREADKRMQLAAKLKKDLDMTNTQVNQLIQALRENPWKVLSNPALGHDVRKLAEEYVWQMIQEQRMTPEQRQAAQDRLELQSMKAQQEQAKKDQEERELNEKIAQRRAYWEKTITESIEQHQLPKTSYTVRRFADYIKAAARARIPADMPAIATQVRQELIDLQSKYLLPPKNGQETDEQYEDRVIKSIPDGVLKLLRKADLRRLRAKGVAPRPGPKPGNSAPPQSSKKMSMNEWQAQRDQRMGRA